MEILLFANFCYAKTACGFGSFFYEKAYNKTLRGYEVLQTSPPKFFATQKTSLNADVI
ncbi:MAG: hypothetical protein KAI55_00170 [Candidatus Aenigmarchaeota archaeon]|nr:hypothetical protein [Candidatus Aenigmarchaeota archaeon]